MKVNIKFWAPALVAALTLGVTTGCEDKLDLYPTNDVTPNVVYSTADGYKQVLAKVYGAWSLTGNNGGGGNADLPGGGDEGWSDFFRLFWQHQELTTDEAICAWGDAGIRDLHALSFGSSNPFIRRLYTRSLFQVVMANEFIKNAGSAGTKGFSQAEVDDINRGAAEAHFIRGFQYWVLMDCFRFPPYVPADFPIGAGRPTQLTSDREAGRPLELFRLIEEEVLAAIPGMSDPRTAEYGRADKAAAWALLARMYLNAEIYTGQPRYADAARYAKMVVDAGYSLAPDYQELYRADNNTNGAQNEFILTINYDGLKTKSFGGSTYLVHASLGGSMRDIQDFGARQKWGGNRTTGSLPILFPDSGTSVNPSVQGGYGYGPDRRGQFWRRGQTWDINAIATFTQGWAITKFKNITSEVPHLPGSDVNNAGVPNDNNFADIDIPLFRLGEMYLIYAEAAARGAEGADRGTAVNYINALRTRAYRDSAGVATGDGSINDGQLTPEFILDERARELYWEGHRRTDLIRYNRFTSGDYVWQWKGNQKEGVGVDRKYEIFPIPSNDLIANTNLVQNPGF